MSSSYPATMATSANKMHGCETTLGIRVIQKIFRLWYGCESVFGGRGPQGQVSVLAATALYGPCALRRILQKAKRTLHQAVEGARCPGVHLQAQPHSDGPGHRTEAGHTLRENQLQKPTEGIGVGEVGRLDDDLPQTLLALGGNEHLLDELPAVRTARPK